MFTRGDQPPTPAEPSTLPALLGGLTLLGVAAMLVGAAVGALWLIGITWAQ
jgi:hypothetical protein